MTHESFEYAARYGENCAEFYDEIYGPPDPNMISTLGHLAKGGRALELGIGTGRVALQLAARGIEICGIEASPSMLGKLREKPGGADLTIVQSNFADAEIDGPFSLIFALASTFFLLSSPEEQQRCFQTVAGLLSEQGVFLIETYEPVGATPVAENGNSAQRSYLAEQFLQTRNGPRHYRVEICYATCQALDEMAARAGLRLRERWSNWQRRPYVCEGPMQISIYDRQQKNRS